MRRLVLATTAIAIAAIAHAVQAAPVITTYGTGGAFVAANPGAVLETFATAIAPGLTAVPTSYDYGGFTIAKEYTSSNGTGSGAGFWRGRPTSSLADVITFDAPLLAWAADFDTQVGGNGVGVQLQVLVEVAFVLKGITIGTVGAGSDPNAAFLGFVTDTPFDTLRITSLLTGADNYTIKNMRYVQQGTGPDPSTDAPAPASLALFAAGLLGLGVLRRNRRGI